MTLRWTRVYGKKGMGKRRKQMLESYKARNGSESKKKKTRGGGKKIQYIKKILFAPVGEIGEGEEWGILVARRC